ncbi:hypothetical protein PHJA_001063900 [Phtheirospermum japonicum]|uniref:Uncharacterized protein n=1 Tax=Phtheirospermum japonicum TaxID=374723 RepID=A0A830C4J3_9LAMI|nr:hypothetical protein PHJA_001063900 [Phtheirospermum japonicum]
MGCSFSCKRLSSSSNSKTIRIVNLNGYIEEIHYPVTVAEISGKPPKHFLFTHAHLLASGSMPLKLDTLLEPGKTYFLLPHSLFGSNVSPVDLAPIARNLASMAANSKSKSKFRKQIRVWSSPATSPKRHFSDDGKSSRAWKPVLATIRERSFDRRSESDLQENVK